MPTVIDSLDLAVDAVLAHIPGRIVLGLPLGIGKPNAFVNRLYERVAADASRQLTIITALSLEKPEGKSELERHFLAPLVERVFQDYPDLAYVKALRHGKPLKVVASDVGYGSEAALSRAFKAHSGLSPREWKRAHATH